MYYYLDVLQRRGQFGLLWLAAFDHADFKRRSTVALVRTHDVEKCCDDILKYLMEGRPNSPRMNLYVTSTLLSGLCVVFRKKSDLAFDEAARVFVRWGEVARLQRILDVKEMKRYKLLQVKNIDERVARPILEPRQPPKKRRKTSPGEYDLPQLTHEELANILARADAGTVAEITMDELEPLLTAGSVLEDDFGGFESFLPELQAVLSDVQPSTIPAHSTAVLSEVPPMEMPSEAEAALLKEQTLKQPLDQVPEETPEVNVEQVPTVMEQPSLIEPEKPLEIAPEEPSVVAPEEPQVVAPEEPQVIAPEEPLVVAPEEPQVVVPEESQVVVPEEPQVVAPEEPHLVAPEEPHLVAPEEPHLVAPEEPPQLEPEANLPHPEAQAAEIPRAPQRRRRLKKDMEIHQNGSNPVDQTLLNQEALRDHKWESHERRRVQKDSPLSQVMAIFPVPDGPAPDVPGFYRRLMPFVQYERPEIEGRRSLMRSPLPETSLSIGVYVGSPTPEAGRIQGSLSPRSPTFQVTEVPENLATLPVTENVEDVEPPVPGTEQDLSTMLEEDQPAKRRRVEEEVSPSKSEKSSTSKSEKSSTTTLKLEENLLSQIKGVAAMSDGVVTFAMIAPAASTTKFSAACLFTSLLDIINMM